MSVFFPLTYLGLAEKVVCEGREQGTGNSEQGTFTREQAPVFTVEEIY
ncbi:MAG: hypothetical protein ACK47Y_12545 [Dolichospermum sp.]